MKTLLSLALLLLLSACQEPAQPEAVIRPAQIWTVGEPGITGSTRYSGEIKARLATDLAFRVGGKVVNRMVETGDTVTAGQVLARLDTADLELNTASARAALAAATADYSNAKTELARVQGLHRKQFIGQAMLDAAQAAFDAAAARVAAARAQLELSDNQASYTELTAARDGVITAVYAEAGQVVAAGQPVVHIAYAGEREAHIRVGESTARNLQTDTRVSVRLWSQDNQPLPGKVREVAPSTDVTRSFLVKITLPEPPADLRLGMTADVELPDSTSADASWLPASALFQQGGQPAVWILDADNKVRTQQVQVLNYGDQGVTVTGLLPDTQVIAAGVHKLSTGQTVNPVAYDGKAGS